MEVGYSTLDLVMLAIAAFVIWLTMNTPKVGRTGKKTGLLKGQPENRSASSVTS
jgi:hypothetical protein